MAAVLNRLPGLVRDLSGSNDRMLVELVGAQIGCAQRGVLLAREVAAGARASGAARQAMTEVEHDGDARRVELIARLRRSVTSPVDREDLFRLSRCVDDILDATRDFVREYDLFGGEPSRLYLPVLDRLAEGLTGLDGAVRLLSVAPRRAAAVAAEAKKPGVRPAYQLAVAEVVCAATGHPPLAAVLLLGRLDVAGQRLAAAADALADGVMKRFQ